MRDIMQSALQPPDLSVWEKTLLPTTSSRIKHSRNGRFGEISYASRPSEAGGTGYHVTRLPGGGTALIELSSSRPEVSWSSYHDTQTSSPPMRCPSYTSEWMGLRGNLALASEVTPDGSICAEWLPTPSISGTTLEKMVYGSLLQISSWIASTIRRITN